VTGQWVAEAAKNLAGEFGQGGDQIRSMPNMDFILGDRQFAGALVGDRKRVSPLAPATDEYIILIGLSGC